VATPSNPGRQAAAREAGAPATPISADLESELQSAADDFERGDYIDLSAEALERCIVTGASPWPAESRG
jgi:hypothetical protein